MKSKLKQVITLLLLLFTSIANAQKCNIKKEVDEMSGVTTYLTTDMLKLKLCIMKNIKENDTSNYAVIKVQSASSNYSAKGYLVKFEDGAIFKDMNIDVDCTYESSYNFTMRSIVKVDPDFLQALMTKKIVKLQLDIYDEEVKEKDAIKIINHVKCMNETW
jgi:hypothetical protein